MAYFRQIRRLAYLAALLAFAFFELARSALARRTFEFSTFDGGRPMVEDRMLYKTASRELNIRSYVEELILGPVSLDLAPLVTKGTGLRSFMFRDGTVYADFSGEAILEVPGGRPLYDSFLTLNRGIRRNFPFVSGVKLFVGGNEVFFDEFSKIFRAD
ncbi:MAG: GerMN domain-containing protein [Treponema sp.]|nr:GerMN domain-containing protein [Treponema sp.]